MTDAAKQSYQYISQKIQHLNPQIAIALGSGLSPLASEIENPICLPYKDIPGFPECTIAGHEGQLIIGTLQGIDVICLDGRIHYYEGINYDAPKVMTRTMKLLGCHSYIATNSSGSLRHETPPGHIVIVNDHINFQFNNPLVGPNDDEFGPRFLGMETIYNTQLRNRFLQAADELSIPVAEGVYLGVLGPTFETPAEIRMFRAMGGDVIGMSTIPEVICAHHCGLKIAVVAVITNLGAGMSDQQLSHDVTLAGAQRGSANLIKLMRTFLQKTQVSLST